MKKKFERLVPFNDKVEGSLLKTQTKRHFEVLRLFNTGVATITKTKLTNREKELFAAFHWEQQRINQLAEIQYLKSYLLQQRITGNQMACYLKKRDAAEIKEFRKLPIRISFDKDKYRSGLPISKFKITNNLNDLRSKVDRADWILFGLRQVINDYEMTDFEREDRKNAGGFHARLNKKIKKGLRKVA